MEGEISTNESPAHGLRQGETLDAEKIVFSCYSNSDRKKFPHFMRDNNWGQQVLLEKNDTPEYLILKLREVLPSASKQIIKKNVDLFDTSKLHRNIGNMTCNPVVDVEAYVSQLSCSRWSGPFKDPHKNWYYFASIDELGSNEYYVMFTAFLDTNEEFQGLAIERFWNTSEICEAKHFFN